MALGGTVWRSLANRPELLTRLTGYRRSSVSIVDLQSELRAKKHSPTLNLGTNGKGDFRTTTNDRAGGLLARTGSLSGHPSK
ncbi:hypothetical protein J6590_065527 [Homalodisca vitripennis]|nr:hypothetical protein J6590_065527 [Homalodisca vitripennis]